MNKVIRLAEIERREAELDKKIMSLINEQKQLAAEKALLLQGDDKERILAEAAQKIVTKMVEEGTHFDEAINMVESIVGTASFGERNGYDY